MHHRLSVVTNEYMKDDFFIKIETWHKPDLGTLENVHKLDSSTWKSVEVTPIDIADKEQVAPGDYKADEDPAIFKSVKTGRGPLGPNWMKELVNNPDCPRMCAYKLVTVKFKWWGLQNRVESFIHKQEKRIFTNFHRQLFCWIDKWVELNMEDIRRMEEETQKELEEFKKSVSKVESSLSCRDSVSVGTLTEVLCVSAGAVRSLPVCCEFKYAVCDKRLFLSYQAFS
ncbi:phosphatidylinositol transfer protein beta isoform isoform X4 [Megalobrama amblycephala]|uniref:phosphatidylinositol transfer protein beta isoform isoform X4 n=1 Tax=Megalobrama amblycephala TaxID=75352 RepID=UPI002014294A|nr:phosphatidylinositol transfer protein beta isoform isoform X4 [Megalobrama amblycephala]